MVGRLPLGSAALAPVADSAVFAFFRRSGWLRGQEGIEALPKSPVVVRVVGDAEAAFCPVAQHQMHVPRFDALHETEQIGVVGELDHELGLGLVGQFGVYNFVAPRAKGGGRLNPAQKIRVADMSAPG